ncbi:alpha/beta fold hydrolase [Paractinoplanes atraurantiacus]|uniref:Pimeloyl-ACP methyl ester carboxylesterase n=1 Tax=Paractinoplanes atraurantiacus TaxID=1036182 RepID=A0A285KK33_9ACTN|nr:alpha/beta fold hydrolase [Actinoplanes atraurantiacus]SNY72999.1 Pimeloyl-ACP methyl ester carboxylesterase [Actinoplanes atraurantiacus]
MPVIDGLHYAEAGHGPGVLLLAGNGARGRTWHLHQVPALVEAGYRVVTYDARGLPPSDTPDVVTMADLVADAATLIERLDLGPCRIAGSSMGARVAAELCLERPDLVDRAVLMATFGRRSAYQAAMTAAERSLQAAGIELPDAYLAVVRAAFNLSPRTLADDRQAQDWLDVFQIPLPGAAGTPSRQEAGAEEDRLKAYGGIESPCLVVGFADDLIAPANGGREVARAIPGARYAEIPDAGHYGYLEQPERLNAELLTFFDGEIA